MKIHRPNVLYQVEKAAMNLVPGRRNEKISDPAGDPGRTDFERGEVDDDG